MILNKSARILLVGVIAVTAWSNIGEAQLPDPARHKQVIPSAYVPLDDPAYALIDALQSRGALQSLSMLERPYRVRDVMEASIPDSTGAAPVFSLERELSRMLRKYEIPAATDSGAKLGVAASGAVFVTAQRSARRELMLGDSTAGIYPGAMVRTYVNGGPWIAGMRITFDQRLKHDPEFMGRVDKTIAGRMEDAYVAGQWTFAEVFFGRLGRNWGPPQVDGLLLGHYAYTYDHLALTLGVPNLHLTTVAARLDDRQVSIDTVAQRYFSIHRLSGRWRNVELAVSEAIVYGGRGRGFEPKWLNPVNGFYLSQLNESPNVNGSSGSDGNISYGVEAAFRHAGPGIFRAQFQLDDIAVNSCDSFCLKPPSYGITLSVDGVKLPGADLIGDPTVYGIYTRVTNLTYRNATNFEQYMINNVGLGRGFSDYDEGRLGLEAIVDGRYPVRAYFAARRQGEGDYRVPQPRPGLFIDTPTFLSGVVEHVSRIAVSGSGSFPRGIELSGDLGYNRVRNAGHVAGSMRNGVEARVVVAYQLPWHLAGTIDPVP